MSTSAKDTTGKGGDIAGGVAELYEEFPYPAHGVISSVLALLLQDTVETMQRSRGTRALDVLDAGCGTGEQTLGIARAYRDSRVKGIDLNRASLKMAQGFEDEHRYGVRFERRNLMAPLDDLGTFDILVSIGVLHSLPEPEVGFRNLRKLAREHTVFLGMVYGAFGKWDMFQVRDALQLIARPDTSRRDRLDMLRQSRLATNVGIAHYVQTARDRLKFGPRIPVREALRRVLAGRNQSYQADSFTHVQEIAYTWSELCDLLHRTGWECIGWPAKSGMPDNPDTLFKGQALKLMREKTWQEQAAIYERIVRPGNLFFLARPR